MIRRFLLTRLSSGAENQSDTTWESWYEILEERKMKNR